MPDQVKENDSTKLTTFCSNCGKQVRNIQPGSLTGWIFKSSSCQCSSSKEKGPELVQDVSQPNPDLAPDSMPYISSELEIKELIGYGGMGFVYKVLDKSDNKIKAVKILRKELAQDKQAVKRFELEVNAVKDLDHPNLVKIYDTGTTSDDVPYLLMEYIEGEPLYEVLRREGRLKPERVIKICTDIADALEAVHAKNIVHRDLKPSNIILSPKDGRECAFVVDFGIAKALPSQSSSRATYDITEAGDVFGSPSYMSPEQCLGFKLDQRSDIYSLGCLLYQMLSGQTPHSASNAVQIIVQQINEVPVPISAQITKDKMAAGLESIALKCLEKEKEVRYQDSNQFLEDLDKVRYGKKLPRRINTVPTRSWFLAANLFALTSCFILLFSYATIFDSMQSFMQDYDSFRKSVQLLLNAGCVLSSITAVFSLVKLVKGSRWSKEWQSFYSSLVVLFVSVTGSYLITIYFKGVQMKGDYPLEEQYFIGNMAFLHILTLTFLAVYLISNIILYKDKVIGFFNSLKRPGCSIIIVILSILLLPQFWSRVATKADDTLSFNLRLNHFRTASKVAYQLDNSNERALRTVAINLASEDKGDEAIKLVTEVIEKHPQHKELDNLYETRSTIYAKMGRLNDAIKDMSKAIELNPKGFNYFQKRSKLYMRTYNYEQALSDQTKEIEKSKTGYEDRCRIFCLTGEYDLALEDITIAIKRSGFSTARLYLIRAAIYEKLNQIDKAKADYKAALEETNQERYNRNLYQSYIYYKLGNIKEFQKCWDRLDSKQTVNRRLFSAIFRKGFGFEIDWIPLEDR